MNRAGELGKSFLFSELAETELNQLATIAREHSFNTGDQLIHQGDEVDGLIIIVKGRVNVSRCLESGDDEDLVVLGSGAFIGEAAAVQGEGDQNGGTVNVRALEKTLVLGISHDDLDDLSDKNPELGYHVYRAICHGVYRRLSRVVARTAYFKALSTLHH